jgi:glycosyltransferase involved in cell wall biosynthesis
MPIAGSCRLVRPDLGGRLLVYVAGEFPGYEARAFQEAPNEWIAAYIRTNVAALATTFKQWPQELVLANHAIMQPYVVRKARGVTGYPPYLVTIHGSALNFSVKRDKRLVPYAVEGLIGAKAIAALSQSSRDDVVDWAASAGLLIEDKTAEVPPGVDVELFVPRPRASALEFATGAGVGGMDVDPIQAEEDDVVLFAGRVLATKGPQYLVAAMPWILSRRPRAHLIIVGDGPMHASLERLIRALDAGDIDEARRVVAEERELAGPREYGAVVPEMTSREEVEYVAAAKGRLARRIRFTGHVDHEVLARIYAAADVAVMPSVFPEAFALVSVEAMAAGAVPIATYQSGLCAAADHASGHLTDKALCELAPPVELTRGIARLTLHALERYPTKDASFRQRLHETAAGDFSWSAVARRYLELAGA